MKFIKIKGHFQSDCLDPERTFIINTDEIVAIYETTARYVINLITPIKEMELELSVYKVYVVGDILDVDYLLEN